MKFTMKMSKDTSVWKRMRANLSKANKGQINVGFFEGSVYPDGLTVAQVAQWQEEGTKNIPSRPFMRYFIFALEKDRRFGTEMAKLINRVALGQLSINQVYAMIGEEAKRDLQKVMVAWSIPPNAPYTIAEKGFNDPLIHTGKMYDSVDWEIGRKGGTR